MITVSFACGHDLQVKESATWTPVCHCGSNQVTGVKARSPHFVGTVTGPYAEYKALAPGVVNVAPGGSLSIKQE